LTNQTGEETTVREVTSAIVGSGNIGTDLMMKLLRADGAGGADGASGTGGTLALRYLAGIDPSSDGLARARGLGLEASAGGVDWLLARDPLPEVVFEATSAKAHLANAPRYAEAGIRAVDLTPAAIGPYVCPPVNLDVNLDAPNLNLITCGGQATIPIVAAVSAVVDVAYAEIVSSTASRSAGPGTRANIDEFTQTTAAALREVGGAAQAKAIILLNPVEPPMIMRNTVFCAIPAEAAEPGPVRDAVSESIHAMAETVRGYVPGYVLKADPQYDPPDPRWRGMARVGVFLEIRGRGDYLPEYAGNLDIITAAAAHIGELLAVHLTTARLPEVTA
jgi:acetaldehyde dehydrogenase